MGYTGMAKKRDLMGCKVPPNPMVHRYRQRRNYLKLPFWEKHTSSKQTLIATGRKNDAYVICSHRPILGNIIYC